VAAARKTLQRRQMRLDPRKLVFIDETSVSTTITRLYGRAPQGERLVQKVLHGNWKTVTFIAALRHDRVTAPFVLEGAMNGETFKAYVEQFLTPTLKGGDIVFMDNASVHMVDGIEEAIGSRGAIPFYLPAYSPDLNPIEQLFAKLKFHASEDCRIFSRSRAGPPSRKLRSNAGSASVRSSASSSFTGKRAASARPSSAGTKISCWRRTKIW